MPTTGQSSSAPVAAGKATDTSIGVPSHVGTVVPAVFPHQRCPSLAPAPWVVHVTAPPNTDAIVALAADGAISPTISPDSTNTLRSLSIRSPIPDLSRFEST